MKTKITYVCQQCAHEEPKWLGKCPECGAWNSFAETDPLPVLKKHGQDTGPSYTTQPLNQANLEEAVYQDTGNVEINRVLGGGVMRGASVLIGGEPGIGKSTLMLQIAAGLCAARPVLYVSGEESPGQIRLRAQRLKINQNNIELLAQTELSVVLKAVKKLHPALVIVDSIQTLYWQEQGRTPGTVTQIKLCTSELNDLIKAFGIPLFMVGHVTKEGAIAGPKVIEHIVDTVLYFDQSGSDIRFLRASKNRFGSVDELGILRMTEQGLLPVPNPALLFLEQRDGEPPPGVCVAPVYEGSRVLLVEIQSLVVPAKSGISRVFSDRVDPRRVSRAAAVLEKHLRVPFSEYDIYVNVAGGMRLEEVGIDLPLALALYSAKMGLSAGALTALSGEVSLAGEVRAVPFLDKRIKSCLEMGFTRIIGPAGKTALAGPAYKSVKTLAEAVRGTFGSRSAAEQS